MIFPTLFPNSPLFSRFFPTFAARFIRTGIGTVRHFGAPFPEVRRFLAANALQQPLHFARKASRKRGKGMAEITSKVRLSHTVFH